MLTVYTLLLVSDGEHDLRAFSTEGARDEALRVEAQKRFDSAEELGNEEDWTISLVNASPAEFINENSYGDTDVYVDTVFVESLEG